MREQIIKFIEGLRNDGTETAFTNGYCYWFAVMLQEYVGRICFASRKKNRSRIVYNPIRNHFAVAIDTTVYDITGEIDRDGFVVWELYRKKEIADSRRVETNCILKLPGNMEMAYQRDKEFEALMDEQF